MFCVYYVDKCVSSHRYLLCCRPFSQVMAADERQRKVHRRRRIGSLIRPRFHRLHPRRRRNPRDAPGRSPPLQSPSPPRSVG